MIDAIPRFNLSDSERNYLKMGLSYDEKEIMRAENKDFLERIFSEFKPAVLKFVKAKEKMKRTFEKFEEIIV